MNSLLLMKMTLPWYSSLQLLPSYIYDLWVEFLLLLKDVSNFNIRFVASAWFFFTLIMVASYTANLAAFLTVETLERPIESVEDLAAQNEIFYGAVSGGSTAGFFAKSNNDVYQRLHMFMSGVHQSEVS